MKTQLQLQSWWCNKYALHSVRLMHCEGLFADLRNENRNKIDKLAIRWEIVRLCWIKWILIESWEDCNILGILGSFKSQENGDISLGRKALSSGSKDTRNRICKDICWFQNRVIGFVISYEFVYPFSVFESIFFFTVLQLRASTLESKFTVRKQGENEMVVLTSWFIEETCQYLHSFRKDVGKRSDSPSTNHVA